MNGCAILLLKHLRDRSHRPRANDPVIDLTQADALRRGPAYKDLVRRVQLVPRNGGFHHLNPPVVCEGHNRIACDAFQHGGKVRRHNSSPFHDEQVLACTFCDVALRFQQNSFVKTQPDRFRLRQETVRVVPGDLRLGHRNIGMVARERRDVGSHSPLERLGSQVIRPLPRCNADRRPAAVDVQIPSPSGKVDQRSDVAFRKSVRANCESDRIHEIVDGIRKRPKTEHSCRLDQAFDMIVQPEDGWTLFRGIAANPFEGSYAVMKCGSEKVERGPLVREQFSVHPDVPRMHAHEFSFTEM